MVWRGMVCKWRVKFFFCRQHHIGLSGYPNQVCAEHEIVCYGSTTTQELCYFYVQYFLLYLMWLQLLVCQVCLIARKYISVINVSKCYWQHLYSIELVCWLLKLRGWSTLCSVHRVANSCCQFEQRNWPFEFWPWLVVSYGAPGVQFSGQHAGFAAVTHICFLAVQVTYQSLTCFPVHQLITCWHRQLF